MKQEVMFTACPQARTLEWLDISVVISPRLDPEGGAQQLSTFPDFLDWPAQNFRWQISVGGETPIDATVISDPPDSTLWTALFSPNTLVRLPVYPDLTQHMWHSYPTGHIVDFIHNLYQQIATQHPTEHPPIPALDALGQIAQMTPDGRDKRPELERLYIVPLQDTLARPPGLPNPEMDFFQLWFFHQAGDLKFPEEMPTFDFHEVLAGVSGHFGLLRRLGLVVDLRIPGRFDISDTTLRVHPAWAPAPGVNNTDVRPITRCTITADRILPTPKGAEPIVNGRLRLNDPTYYRVVTVNPDGAALNLMMLARNLIFGKLFPSVDTPKEEPLPALDTSGISVVRTGHTASLVEHVKDNFQLHTLRTEGNDAAINLYAEDLWAGTRFDVRDVAAGPWRSLQQTQTDYNFLSLPAQVQIAEEGMVVVTPTARDEDGENPDGDALYQQESLMVWDGWSLGAERPGSTLDEQDQVIDPPEDPLPEYPLHIHARARPGSLPRLRFGRRYQVRARVVDPAGNSVPFDEDVANTADVVYRRYEPVLPPFVLLTAPRTEGESDAHVPLRSNYNAPPDPTTAERILAPPRAAQITAEQHGMWDANWANAAANYAQILAREDKGFHMPEYGTPDPNNYDQPYLPDKPVPVPYLPDPMARGAALRFYPESGGDPVDELVSFDTGAPWPEARPVRLIVVEGNGPPTVQEIDGEVEVRYPLPKAETARVRVSSYVSASDLPLSAIWQLMLNSNPSAGQLNQWQDLATKGRLWMLTPYRTLTLVHAVRQPLKPPAFLANSLSASRQPGDTFANLGGVLEFSRKSTARVDLHASWQEPVDLGPGDGVPATAPLYDDNMRPHEEWLELPLVEQTGGPEAQDFLPIISRRHEFHDTKRRDITYRLKATSKFTEYYQVRLTNVQVSSNQVVPLDGAPLVEDVELVRASGDGPSFDRGVHYTIDYAAGSLTWTGGNAAIDIVYLSEPVSRLSEEAPEAASRAITLQIPSTARPHAPKVLYAIPTYRWQTTLMGSTGKGGGLRIYLDRPFFETGQGQLLGVVLDPSHNSPSAALAAYTTRWGFDPIHGLPALPTKAPRPQDFPLRVSATTNTPPTLAETGATVNVAGHAVGFDAQRNLWYCDIEVLSGQANLPFIRLALASFQPGSLPNLYLSPVVLADIVQLVPDRTATLQLKGLAGSPPSSVEITIVGTSSRPGTSPEGLTGVRTQMTAYLEQRRGDIADALLGWEPVSHPDARGTLQATQDGDGMTIWQGELSLPAGAARQAQAGEQSGLRVVVEEWQSLLTSDDLTLYLPDVQSGGPAPSGSDASEQERLREVPPPTRRLVFRDFIPIEF